MKNTVKILITTNIIVLILIIACNIFAGSGSRLPLTIPYEQIMMERHFDDADTTREEGNYMDHSYEANSLSLVTPDFNLPRGMYSVGVHYDLGDVPMTIQFDEAANNVISGKEELLNNGNYVQFNAYVKSANDSNFIRSDLPTDTESGYLRIDEVTITPIFFGIKKIALTLVLLAIFDAVFFVGIIKTPGFSKKTWEMMLEIAFLLATFVGIMIFVRLQPFGDPPDEINRFKVVYYIFNHGKLPIGSDPEILLDGYGASYAFQPMLTYIIEGWVLRLAGVFTKDAYTLIVAARMVNVVFGVLMAYYVRKIAKLVFENPYYGWMFSFLVVFLPQNLFIHSYVNTDSMAMLSIAMILYAMLLIQKDGYNIKNEILMAVGCTLCIMSYYNAYGIVLVAAVFVLLTSVKDKNIFIKNALPIAGMIVVANAWWFVRNAILYKGDFIAMKARQMCSIETSSAEYNPLTRFTYQKEGIPLKDMLFGTGYIKTQWDSFVAVFGPMSIVTNGEIYNIYKWLCIIGLVLALVFLVRLGLRDKGIIYLLLLVHCLITIFLSVYYSYTWEYQPQGRYILPILVPLMLYVTLGFYGMFSFASQLLKKTVTKGKTDAITLLGNAVCIIIILFVAVAYIYSINKRFIPYYTDHIDLPNLSFIKGQTLDSIMGL